MNESGSRRSWIALSLAGILLAALISGFVPYLNYMMHTTNPAAWGIFPLGGMVLYFAVCGINAWRVRKGRKRLLDPAQTLCFFFILTMGSWAATWGFTESLMPTLTSPAVWANPQNGWQEFIVPYMKPYLMGPATEPWASAFWDGLPSGMSVPWKLWLVPVALWTFFAMVLSVFCISLGGLLGRHWIEHDRLAFPHAEVLMGMARDFLSNKLFWWGVATAAAVPAWNLMVRFFPVFPPISLYFGGGGDQGVEWLKGADKLVLVLDFMMLGLFYFVHRHIVTSIAVFFFVIALENYFLDLAGIKLGNEDLFQAQAPVGWQSMGALLSFVVFGLWSARSWLAGYFKDAWRGKGVEKSWLPPRWNVIAFALSFAFLTLWMAMLGLGGRGLVSFMISKVLLYIGVARVTAESAVEAWMNVVPRDFAVLLGTKYIGPAGLAAMVMSLTWLTDPQLSMSTRMIEAERTRTSFRFPRSFLAVLVAVVGISTAVAMYSTVHLAYTHAASNFGTWAYNFEIRERFNSVVECGRITTGVDWLRIMWFMIGGVIVAALMFLRNNVVGWTLHPIGFVIAGTSRAANKVVFICVLAWSVKTLLLKLGGVQAYEKYKPFFAGLVVGAFLPWALGMCLDPFFFPRRGMEMPLIM